MVVVGVAQQLIEPAAVLHAVQQAGLHSGIGDFAQPGLDGVHGQPQRRHRVDHHVVTDVGEPAGAEQRRLAELGHVGQQRRVEGGAESLEFRGALQRLGEDQVGARVGVGPGPFDRGGQALDRGGVGAGADDEVRVPAGRDGGAEPSHHLVDRHHRLAVEMSAPFRVYLVLQVAAGQPGVLEHRHRAGGVQRFAEPGVGVDQGGQLGDRGDLGAAAADLGQGGQADVGQAEVGRERGAGHIHPVESEFGDQLGHQR